MRSREQGGRRRLRVELVAASLLLASLPFVLEVAPVLAQPAEPGAELAGEARGEGRWAAEIRFGALALERSGGGDPETRTAGGLRAGLRLLEVGWFRLDASAGWLLGRAQGGTEEVFVRTWHHLLDLRAEAGLQLGPLTIYLAGGPLLDLTWVSLHALEDDDSGVGLHPGAVYGIGLFSEPALPATRLQLLLRMELGGLRRGAKDDIHATFGAGLRF